MLLFWTCFMAGLLLLLAMGFKVLSASFEGLMEGLRHAASAAITAFLIILLLFLIDGIKETASSGKLLEIILEIALVLIIAGGLIALILGLGAQLVILIANLVTCIITNIARFFNWVSEKIEGGFAHFLNVLIKRTGEL